MGTFADFVKERQYLKNVLEPVSTFAWKASISASISSRTVAIQLFSLTIYRKTVSTKTIWTKPHPGT
jgi:hypothetical protein